MGLKDTFPIRRGAPARSIMDEYRSRLRPHVGNDGPQHLVGHRLGAVARYPDSFKKGQTGGGYDGVVELMDHGYRVSQLTTLELDVRVLGGDDDEPVVVVTHDPLPRRLPPAAVAYLEYNSLDNLFRHYVRKGYYRDRQLAVELKADDPDLAPSWLESLLGLDDDRLERAVARTVATLERHVEAHPEAARIRASVEFVSFNFKALKLAHERAGDGYRYHLIATTNKPGLNLIAVLWDDRDPISGSLIDKVKRADWLTGVWFDPQFVRDAERLFGDIDRARPAPLELYASTYHTDGVERFVSYFEKGAGRLAIAGLIFDLKDD